MSAERLVLVQPDPKGRIYLDAHKTLRRRYVVELIVSFDHDEIEYARERASQIAAFLDLPLDDLTEAAKRAER